jgi:hypothetical protein
MYWYAFYHTPTIDCNLLMFPLWLLWTSLSRFGWNKEMAPIASRTRCNHQASGQTLWCCVHESCLCRNNCQWVNDFRSRNTGMFPLDPNIFPNWMFQPSETADRPLAEVSLHPTHMAVRNVCDDADVPHIRIQGCPYSLLVKLPELPEFSQTSMKPCTVASCLHLCHII